MHRTEIVRHLAEILDEVAGVDAAKVTEDAALVDDLDVDSLSLVEVVVVIEDRLGVSLPEELVRECRTVGDVAEFIADAAVPA